MAAKSTKKSTKTSAVKSGVKEINLKDLPEVKEPDVDINKFKFEIDKPVEEGKLSFKKYFAKYSGTDNALLDDAKNKDDNESLCLANMVRCIRIQIKPERASKAERQENTISIGKAIESAEKFVNEYLEKNLK